MNYKAYRLKFKGAVHFGSRSLESGCSSFCADTLFSALCQEALKRGEDIFRQFYGYAKNGQLLLSDAFPYVDQCYFLPKPVMHIETAHARGDSVVKKAYKKLKYIPADAMNEYLSGQYDVLHAPDLSGIGESVMKVSASIRGEEETKPYRIQAYYYHEGNGLYFILGYQEQQMLSLTEELLQGLSYSGIGGKRAAGMGRFALLPAEMPIDFFKRTVLQEKKYMSLSVCLPRDDELEQALLNAQYIVCKRSGFVDSLQYAKMQMRKRDLYVLQAGSCFCTRYEGDIYDVSGQGGNHPVYRYAKPMFMEV